MTDMLSRLPRCKQWSIKHSHTAPRSQGRGGGGGGRSLPPAADDGSSASPSGSRAGSSGRPSRSISRTLSTTSLELITSQMPSHASTINSSCGERGSLMISGKAVTACSLGSAVAQNTT